MSFSSATLDLAFWRREIDGDPVLRQSDVWFCPFLSCYIIFCIQNHIESYSIIIFYHSLYTIFFDCCIYSYSCFWKDTSLGHWASTSVTIQRLWGGGMAQPTRGGRKQRTPSRFPDVVGCVVGVEKSCRMDTLWVSQAWNACAAGELCHWYHCISHIGSMVLLYMVTWIPSIYPSPVSIYTSTMDPSWLCQTTCQTTWLCNPIWGPINVDKGCQVLLMRRPLKGMASGCATGRSRPAGIFFSQEWDLPTVIIYVISYS